MNLWIVQWNAKRPCFAKVNVNAPPGGRYPDEKASPSAVTVWLIESSFFQVTLVPTSTDSCVGS